MMIMEGVQSTNPPLMGTWTGYLSRILRRNENLMALGRKSSNTAISCPSYWSNHDKSLEEHQSLPPYLESARSWQALVFPDPVVP